MFGLNWKTPNRLNFKHGYNVFRTHLIVFLLAAAIVDVAPFVVSKSTFLSATNIGPEDNFIADGTSYVWAVLFPVFIFCGLFSSQIRQRLIDSIQSAYLLIFCVLPLIFFSCLKLFFGQIPLDALLKVILPFLHLGSLWVWFVAFRPCFNIKIFYNYVMLCLGLVVSLQILSALAIIPGSEIYGQKNFALLSNNDVNISERSGPKYTALTPSRDYLKFFSEDGYIPILKEEPASSTYGEVDLYQHLWLYVIDQNLHYKHVPFKKSAESGFLLCFATWVACILFWRRLSWPFLLIYPLCLLGALLSSSRAGVWGSCIVLIFSLLALIWEKSRIVTLGILTGLISIGSWFFWHYSSAKTTYVVPTEALDYFNFFGLKTSTGFNLLTMLDYSFYFRLEEFKTFLFARSFQELFFGSSITPEFSHSFALTFATIFGLLGFALLLFPLSVIFVIGLVRFKSVHVLTAAGVVFINFMILDIIEPWLVAFPIFLVMLQKHLETNVGKSIN